MIYFDNAAAMCPVPEVLDYFRQCSERCFANQEAGHGAGYELRRELSQAEDALALTLAGKPFKTAWADSGTGLCNMVAALPVLKGGNIVTTPLEHPALIAALSRSGAEIRLLPLLKNGLVDWEKGAALLDSKTRLIALFHVQSELGLIQEYPQLRELAPKALLMYDTVQSVGKMPLPEADMLTVSGHKLGAPGGAALVYNPAKISPAEFEAMRSRNYLFGRIEPATALTLAHAVRRRTDDSEIRKINEFLRRELTAKPLPNGRYAQTTIPAENASPYILHLFLPGYQGQVLVRMLSESGIYLSSGSACQAESDRPSPALTALGFSRTDGYSGLRLSFSESNTMEEAALFADTFRKAVAGY